MNKKKSSYLMLYMASALFALTSVIVKMASRMYSGLFISSVRFLFGIVFISASLLLLKKGFRIHNKKAWIGRGISGAGAMIAYYLAIHRASSGRATLLANTYPLFVAIIGYMIFKEKIVRNTIGSLIFCTAGVLLVLNDGSHYNIFGDLIALGSGIASGFAVHFIKKGRETDNSFIIYLSPCLFGLAMLPLTYREFGSVNPKGFLLLFLIGLLSFLAQFLMAYGYKEISASKGSVVFYLETALAIVFSIFIGERLSVRFLAGLGLILLGLLINNSRFRIHDSRVSTPD
jgi:drug/metabolite transporter (DMT)-like permease